MKDIKLKLIAVKNIKYTNKNKDKQKVVSCGWKM